MWEVGINIVLEIEVGKTLILLRLGGLDRELRRQNIDSQAVAPKILRKKKLAARSAPRTTKLELAPDASKGARTTPL
jgi:hypothetical protein